MRIPLGNAEANDQLKQLITDKKKLWHYIRDTHTKKGKSAQ